MGDGIKRRELSGLSSLGVVNLSTGGPLGRCEFRVDLQESYEEHNLKLGSKRDGIPLLRGGEIGTGVGGTGHGLGPGEDEVGLDDVSDEGSHGNTAMLDLSMTEPPDGGCLILTPETSISQTQGIEISNNRIQLLTQSLKVGLNYKFWKLQRKY